MKRAILFLLCALCFLTGSAEILKGKVITATGEPIPYSTIYIQELTSGIIADEQGNFQTRVKPGTYTCEIRSIGFESKTITVKISSGRESTGLEVVLTQKIHVLNEVVITPSKEDPAYRVMRLAISRAPYHLYQVSGFTSENYMKGSAKIEKIPGLLKMMIKDKKMLSLVGKLMILESQNEVTYQSPAHYKQKVIAYKSSIPKEIEPKGGIRTSTSSIYEANFMDYISPFSPQAFRYYQFKLEDIFENGNYQVNKIKVIPKVNNSKLFSGHVYILENNWSVFSADLSTNEMGTTSRYKINYQEVKPSVFLPITFDMYANIGTMGVKGYARFYSSVKYKTIKVNESVNLVQNQKTATNTIHTVSKKQKKTLQKIEELSLKENLSTNDAIKLSRLMTSTIEPKELKARRDSLEIKDIELVKMEVDSLATKRDSVYWEEIRKVPLRVDEAASFKEKDSIPVSENVKTSNNSIEITFGKPGKSSALTGGNIKLGNSAHLFYDGLLKGVLKEYNFVDGFWLGQKISLSVSTTKSNSLNISPSVYYTTARKAIVWDVNTVYRYAPLLNGQLKMNIGNSSADIQGDKGTSRLFNSISSLFVGDNVIRFYQKKYFTLENDVDVLNGLRLTAGAGYENRELVNNQTDYHFFGQTPQPNYPDQAYRDAFPTHTSTTAWLKLEYTPYYKYRIKDGKKEYANSAYPTFAIAYKKAIPLLSQSRQQSSYDKITFFIGQNLILSEFDRLNYRVTVGSFLSKKFLFAPDLYYFATSPFFITNKLFDNTFNLLENYSNSNSRWLETHLNWTSDYLLLKRIGFLQPKLFNESLQLNLLWNIRNEKPYAEAGYSIGLNNLGRIGIFVGFDGINYQNIGIKVSFPLFTVSGK